MQGHEADAQKLLDPYLPKGEPDNFGFKEGGSLYAYGLIHANHGNSKVITYLRDQLQNARTSAARHGACLGLGLAAMGTQDDEVFMVLNNCYINRVFETFFAFCQFFFSQHFCHFPVSLAVSVFLEEMYWYK